MNILCKIGLHRWTGWIPRDPFDPREGEYRGCVRLCGAAKRRGSTL